LIRYLFVFLALIIVSPLYALAASIIVDLEGTPVEVSYETEGVKILSITPDLDFISLLMEVKVTGSPGILEITFDREFFDAKFAGQDDSFIVLADGDEPGFEETETTPSSRTLRIELPTGTEEVEIIGSVFGTPQIAEPEEQPEEPMVEEPVAEEPVAEEMQPEEKPPMVSQPKVECGPGTILKDGVCVVDERCGPGTIMQDGVCVPAPAESTFIGGQGLIYGAAAAFIIAFIIIFILYGISRASRQRPQVTPQ